MLGDPLKVLGGVELSLSNVLIPECTEGQTFDALYCDAALSEEDLPTFLALLKPNGRMVVIIEEVSSCRASSSDTFRVSELAAMAEDAVCCRLHCLHANLPLLRISKHCHGSCMKLVAAAP